MHFIYLLKNHCFLGLEIVKKLVFFPLSYGSSFIVSESKDNSSQFLSVLNFEYSGDIYEKKNGSHNNYQNVSELNTE